MKVAVFGSYNYGNYGDDLMGVMFADRLKKLGASPIVYRLDPALANKYGLQTTQSLDELLSGSQFCIVGGGGLLIGKSKLSQVDEEIEDDFESFALATQKYNCPLHPLSIGGDGRGVKTPFPRGRYRLFSGPTCQFTTVRNQSDIALMAHLGKEAVHYPDVLWGAPSYWNLQPHTPSTDTLKIGINLADTRKHRTFVSVLLQLAKLKQQKVEIHLIRSHLAQCPIDYEMLPEQGDNRDNLHSYTYQDPVEMLSFLGSLDVLVSQKLHLGLSALAMGVPFVSYGGQGKTRTLLKSIGADRAIAATDKVSTLKLAWNLMMRNQNETRNIFDFESYKVLDQHSQQHMTYLASLVERYAPPLVA